MLVMSARMAVKAAVVDPVGQNANWSLKVSGRCYAELEGK